MKTIISGLAAIISLAYVSPSQGEDRIQKLAEESIRRDRDTLQELEQSIRRELECSVQYTIDRNSC